MEIGGLYRVKCIYEDIFEDIDWSNKIKIDDDGFRVFKSVEPVLKVRLLTPIYDNLHNDPENGQALPHYHIDYRWTVPEGFDYKWEIPKHISTRVFPDMYTKTDFFYLELRSFHHVAPTPVQLISKSPMSSEGCITEKALCPYPKNHKCLHKGFYLGEEKPDVYGIVTCPLHSMKYIKSN